MSQFVPATVHIHVKSPLNYGNVELLKVKDVKWKFDNGNSHDGSFNSQDVSQAFDANVSNDDEFDIKSRKHLRIDFENEKLCVEGIYSQKSLFTNKFKFVDNNDNFELHYVKYPVQKVVSDGSHRKIMINLLPPP